MRGALAAGIAEVLLLTSLTLAGVTAARMKLAIAKVELIIEDTPKLKAKWQNDVNVFLAMNDEPTVRPTAHIFVADKTPWFEIKDDLPQYRKHRQF